MTPDQIIYNLLVMYSDRLDNVFSALGDATRRGMLARLAQGEANVSTLAADYAMSQPAISKHIRVLEKAGLVEKTKRGRETLVHVKPEPLEEARSWIAYYARFWKAQFDAVDEYLQTNTTDQKGG